MISSDKAVRPTNIMGATKRFAEIIIQSINASTDVTRFSMVRFGNVINSSWSVIPLFLDQIYSFYNLTVHNKYNYNKKLEEWMVLGMKVLQNL